jgi:hypothetical protein
VGGTYRYLSKKHPDTGLLLRCCGAPAEWSGDEEKFEQELAAIRSAWKELGDPTLIMACPTCEKKFKTYMTEIPVISLYEIIEDWGLEMETQAGKSGTELAGFEGESGKTGAAYSVFDACAARHEARMKQAVRTLAESAGYHLEPLKEHEAHEQCCSFGGQPGAANPEYAAFVVEKRTAESENPYITYCINCRDVFLDAGKEALHILDILFGGAKTQKRLPTVSRRRENRILLKRKLLKEFWGEEPERGDKTPARNVNISEELARKLSKERILEEDVIDVIDFCERTGRRVFLPEKETYSGYREVGYMTYWVEYRPLQMPGTGCQSSGDSRSGCADTAETAVPGGETCYELVNAYAHRIKIELEAVWNGKKMEHDQ